MTKFALIKYVTKNEIEQFRKSGVGIFSITVYAEKPEVKNCCGADCCS